jgi:sterol desaturase/sphingolipid hydroxylase (fatty acid hydroxylase superfamily)
MIALKDLPAGLVISCVAGSIMFFVPTYVLHTACYPWLRSRRIRYDQPHASVSIKNPPSTDEQLRREWRNAMWTSVGGLGTAVLERALVEMEFVRPLPYDDDATNNWAHIARQFLVYFLLFDCYYYFLHRFFFHGRWGWRMHRVHHDSLVCYPSTGFSFHWFEGAITGGLNPLLAHCLRFDRRTVAACQVYGVLNTIFVHAGIQLTPTWWDRRWWSRWYLSSQFHDVHHQMVGCNYGGFTTVYDRLFGTVYHKYDDMVDRLASRIESSGGASIRAADAVPRYSARRSECIAERGRPSALGSVALDSQPSSGSSRKEDDVLHVQTPR